MNSRRIMLNSLGTSNRSTGGFRAQKSGRAHEKAMEHMHHAYANAGRAAIVRQSMETVPCGDPKKGMRRVTGGAPVDFMGTLRGGRAVLMELKSSAKRQASLAISDSGISLAQIDVLLRHHSLGAVVAVVWSNAEARGVLLGESLILAREKYGEGDGRRKSIPRDEFVWIEGWDWLFIVEKRCQTTPKENVP